MAQSQPCTAVRNEVSERLLDEAAWVLDRLTARQEARQRPPCTTEDAAAGFMADSTAALIGIEISIDRIEATLKLKQNKSVEALAAVIKSRRQRAEAAEPILAAWMQAPLDLCAQVSPV